MDNDIQRVIFTHDDIIKKCQELGKQITEDYQENSNLILIGLLKGSVPFIADLMKEIDLHLSVDYMDVSSYHGGTASTGEIKILKDLDTPINGRDVLIVEDIVDTGKTLKTVMGLFNQRGAKSVKVVSLVDKPSGRQVPLVPDYVGMEVGNEFIVGYGLDYKELYRNLKYIGVLKEEVYQ